MSFNPSIEGPGVSQESLGTLEVRKVIFNAAQLERQGILERAIEKLWEIVTPEKIEEVKNILTKKGTEVAWLVSWLPYVGSPKVLWEAIVGTTASGHQLNHAERSMYALSVVASILSLVLYGEAWSSGNETIGTSGFLVSLSALSLQAGVDDRADTSKPILFEIREKVQEFLLSAFTVLRSLPPHVIETIKSDQSKS